MAAGFWPAALYNLFGCSFSFFKMTSQGDSDILKRGKKIPGENREKKKVKKKVK